MYKIQIFCLLNPMESLDDLSFSNKMQFSILLNYFTNFYLKVIIIRFKFH